MQRANRLDIERSGLLENRLHLVAVLANDIEVITSSFAGPVIRISSVHAKLTEGIGCKQNLFGLLIAEQDFGPMHHRRTDKLQGVSTESKRVAFFHGLRLG